MADASPTSSQVQIVVLGMHRSGTSALSLLLQQLGVYFGLDSEFISANHENPHGFSEREDVRELNDEILYALDCDWDEVSLLDLKRLSTDALKDFDQKANDILNKMAQQPVIGLKEPRFCVLLPLWQRVLSNPVYIRSWRHPSEIAASLHARSNMPESIANTLSNYYYIHCLLNTAEQPAIGLDYQTLLDSPLSTAQTLHAFLSKLTNTSLPAAEANQLNTIVSKKLNRSGAKTTKRDLTALESKIYRAVLESGSTDLALSDINPSSLSQLKDYELRQRFTQRRKIRRLELAFQSADTRREHSDSLYAKQQEHSKELSDLYKASRATIVKLQSALASETQAAKAIRSEFSKAKLDIQESAASKDMEIHKLKSVNDDYVELNQLLSVFFGSRSWKIVSKAFSAVSKLSGGRGAATILHKITEVRSRFTATTASNYVLEKSEGYSDARTPKLSLIVLNRNGEIHIRNFLSSLLEHENISDLEVIFVDHHSTDGSNAEIKRYFSKLKIKLMHFKANNSFSAGNNLAVKLAEANTLVFLNNDIIFDQPIFEDMQTLLEKTLAPAIGLPLYYPCENGKRSEKIQHAGVEFAEDAKSAFQRPYNLKTYPKSREYIPLPAVTAALLMCKKSTFNDIGGFNERYQYGYEDVALCLAMARHTGRVPLLAAKLGAIHDESASQRKEPIHKLYDRRNRNVEVIKAQFGRVTDRYSQLRKLSSAPSTDEKSRFTLGLVVTDDTDSTSAGDYFTALEFAQAVHEELGWEFKFLAQRSKTHDWYDTSGLDCIIVLVDRYDIRNIVNAKHNLITVAWVRNWFERWPTHPWFRKFDLMLSSSVLGGEHLTKACQKPYHLLRIATNTERFKPQLNNDEKYHSDYCFTGSYWNVEREIERFHPENLPFEFALYGDGWGKHSQFSNYYRGFVEYKELPQVYAGTKLLVDDANHVTKPWGSVNSRVFDGIAAGAMVISNGITGAEEVFEDALPTYDSADELQSLIEKYVQDDDLRKQVLERQRTLVMNQHTYRHRANEFKNILIRHLSRLQNIAIKIGVPSYAKAPEWGDFHFAKALQKELIRIGHQSRVDILPEWYGPQTKDDTVVIVLRGLSEYQPKEDHINLMWMISHPDKVSAIELDKYQHIFVASKPYTDVLANRTTTSCSTLLQCTDHEAFYPSETPKREDTVLFVGNSRMQYRPIVKDAVAAELDLHVYGSRWGSFIPEKFVRGQHLENETLKEHYSSCAVLLNDHWQTMRQHGFISNRLFDAAACGATVVSDKIDGVEELFKGEVYTYNDSSEDLARIVKQAKDEKQHRELSRAQLASYIRERHSFRARAEEIHELICSKSLATILSENHLNQLPVQEH